MTTSILGWAARPISQPRHRAISSPPTFIPPLPRFTLLYLLESSSHIRGLILARLQHSLPALLSLRLVNKALAKYTSLYLFKEVWLGICPDYWRDKDMSALGRFGQDVQRFVIVLRHDQPQEVEYGTEFNGTRIPYATGRDYELELYDESGREEGRALAWKTMDHLNPVPEIIEFHNTPDTKKEGEEKQKTKGRKNIQTEVTGGPPNTLRYGSLYHTVSSTTNFKELFLRTPNLNSLVIQAPGDDVYWEYSCVDIALESIRSGAIAAGINLQELACLPIHILGLETLSSIGKRIDTIPDAFNLLGWGRLKRLELAINARVLISGGETGGRNKVVYGRIVRGFLLALGSIGRNGLETFKFQWTGGEGGTSRDILECPFLINNPMNTVLSIIGSSQNSTAATDAGEDNADTRTIATLVFPHLTRIYIRNVTTTASALADFFDQRAKKCAFVSTREVLLTDGEDQVYAMRRFEPLWERRMNRFEEKVEGIGQKRMCIFSGDYKRLEEVKGLRWHTTGQKGKGKRSISGPY